MAAAEGKHDKAIAALRAAVRRAPRDPQPKMQLADLLRESGRNDEAITTYRGALALAPNSHTGHNNLGIALMNTGRHDEAIACYRRAIKLNKDYVRAHNNLASSLHALDRYDEAIEHATMGLNLDPSSPLAHYNLANIYRSVLRLNDSLHHYEQAIALRPGTARYHWNYALTLLLAGDLAKGWRDYEWRWEANPAWVRRYRFKQWAGETTPGGRLLLWGEQGVGDIILYASMIAELVAAGLKITLETDPRLVTLMQRSFPGIRVVGLAKTSALDPGEFDWQSPLGSLGAWRRPDMDSFPRHACYLKPDEARAATLAARLRAPGPATIVGISWSSANADFGARKTIALTDWADILRVPGVRFVDLQYGDTREAREAAARAGLELMHLDDLDLYNDLEGLAALCAACDLVITSSNVTAHMAGAIGKPVWLLAPRSPGRIWYWHTGLTESPWYPSVRIYSEERTGSWQEPVKQVALDLAKFANDQR
jgi:Flp pilus assembly protein TadD/ADP-heptose:LPS heptosyltransferase